MDQTDVEPGEVDAVRPHQRDVQYPPAQLLHLFGGLQLAQFEPQRGIVLPAAGEDLRQHAVQCRFVVPDDQRGEVARDEFTEISERHTFTGEHRLRLPEKKFPGGGKSDGAARPLEKTHPQFILEFAHRRTQRSLRHVQLLRRPPEVQFSGDGDKVAQSMQFHRSSFRHIDIFLVMINID